VIIGSELGVNPVFNGQLLQEVIKQQVGERVFDMGKTWKSDSLNAGRKERLKGFANFLGTATRELVMSNFSSIVMGSAMTLYTFDWNKSDKQLEEELKACETAMYSAGGRFAAQGIVRYAGIQSTAKARHRYPQIDPSILADIDEENRDELRSAIGSMLTTMRSSLQKSMFINAYMSGRKMFGYQDKKDESKPNEPWILSDQLDKIAESQKDEKLKAMLTGFKDEMEDAVFDMGYLITNGVQTQWRLSQMAQNTVNGPKRLVRYTPDISEPNTHTFVHGSQEAVKTAIQSARLGQIYLKDKDIGEVAMVGIQRAMQANLSERILTVYYYSGQNGASSTPQGRSSKRQLTGTR
jgi:hypothetical protein